MVPTQKEVRAEAAHRQGDKDGVEIDQGLFFAHALSRPRIGEHLCHAMLLPRPEIAALAAEFASRGSLDLGAARWPGLRAIFSNEAIRDWFYHRARRPTGEALRTLARPEQKVVVIGDAAQAGKSRPAIASAFAAALLEDKV